MRLFGSRGLGLNVGGGRGFWGFGMQKAGPGSRFGAILARIGVFVNMVMVLCLASGSVSAVLPGDSVLDRLESSGAYYYNPAGSDESCSSSVTTLTGNSVVEKAWNYFVGQGFDDAQVAGILGNAQMESGFSVTRSSTGSYWGIFQWGGGRRDALEAKVRAAGLERYLDSSYWAAGAAESIPAGDQDELLRVSLDHAMSETDHDWQNEIKSATSPEEAAEVRL